MRTTLKVCKLGERILEGSSTSSGGGGYLNEESILDLGRALYKLHLQLLLLLEAAAKMYVTLSSSASENKVSRLCATIVHTSVLERGKCAKTTRGLRLYVRVKGLQHILGVLNIQHVYPNQSQKQQFYMCIFIYIYLHII